MKRTFLATLAVSFLVTLMTSAVLSAQLSFTDENVDSFVGKVVIDKNAKWINGDGKEAACYPANIATASNNCVDYALGRMNERIGVPRGLSSTNPWYSGNGKDVANNAKAYDNEIRVNVATGKAYRIKTYFNDGGANIKANSLVSFDSPSAPAYGHVVFVEHVKTDSDGTKWVYYTENVGTGKLYKVTLSKFVSGNLNSWTSTYRGVVCYEEIKISDVAQTKIYNGHIYAIYDGKTSWQQAKRFCEGMGGHLAVITSDAEQAAIQKMLTPYGYACWIGALKSGSSFSWIDGSAFSYTNWDSGEPSGGSEAYMGIYANDTQTQYSTTGKWNDFANYTGTVKGFICEWDRIIDIAAGITNSSNNSDTSSGSNNSSDSQTSNTTSNQTASIIGAGTAGLVADDVKKFVTSLSETEWSDWTTLDARSVEGLDVQTKTQHGYYHYVLTWPDPNGVVGAYPINAATMGAQGGITKPAIEAYHEYWSDTKLTAIPNTGLIYQINGQSVSYSKFDNHHCVLSGASRVASINHLYALDKTRTVYRYKKKVTTATPVETITPSASPSQPGKSVKVTLPTFNVTLGGLNMDNAYAKYPLILYKNITYFPMTYYDMRLLGVATDYSPEEGLKVFPTNETIAYKKDTVSSRNSSTQTATIATGRITVNGRVINNATEQYPFLLFRDVTYFPLTWDFAHNEFGWYYNYTTETGLVIDK